MLKSGPRKTVKVALGMKGIQQKPCAKLDILTVGDPKQEQLKGEDSVYFSVMLMT